MPLWRITATLVPLDAVDNGVTSEKRIKKNLWPHPAFDSDNFFIGKHATAPDRNQRLALNYYYVEEVSQTWSNFPKVTPFEYIIIVGHWFYIVSTGSADLERSYVHSLKVSSIPRNSGRYLQSGRHTVFDYLLFYLIVSGRCRSS